METALGVTDRKTVVAKATAMEAQASLLVRRLHYPYALLHAVSPLTGRVFLVLVVLAVQEQQATTLAKAVDLRRSNEDLAQQVAEVMRLHDKSED